MPRVPQADPGANNPMSQRNYACDNIIMKYFGGSYPADFDAVGELVLKRQLWQWGTPTHNLPTHRLHMQLAKCGPALWPAVCAIQIAVQTRTPLHAYCTAGSVILAVRPAVCR